MPRVPMHFAQPVPRMQLYVPDTWRDMQNQTTHVGKRKPKTCGHATTADLKPSCIAEFSVSLTPTRGNKPAVVRELSTWKGMKYSYINRASNNKINSKTISVNLISSAHKKEKNVQNTFSKLFLISPFANMKVTTSIALLGAASLAHGLAVPRDIVSLDIVSRDIVSRDQKTVVGVLSSVQASIDSLDNVVKAGVSDLSALLGASNKLIDAISSGTTTVTGTSSLTLIETIKIIKPVQSLQAHAKTLVDDLKAKKQQIEQGGLCGVVAQQIGTIDQNSQALVKATVSKTAQIAQTVAAKVAQPILDILADAKTSFNDQNCQG